MDNPEKLATLGTQDTGRKQTRPQTNKQTTQKTKMIRISDRLDPVPIFGALSVANRYFL
jgi:hypothetical protein